MTTAVDTNVLLDVVSNDPSFGQDASDALYAAIVAGAVMICTVGGASESCPISWSAPMPSSKPTPC